jgi:putative transposase
MFTCDLWPTRHAHSSSLLLVHLVWSTRDRLRWLDPAWDSWLARVLARQARALDCQLLAAGNADDHVHTVACYPPRVAVADLVQRLKGASSYTLNRARPATGPYHWQVGYWAESVSPSALEAVAAYVCRQRDHHRDSTGAEEWETSTTASPPGGLVRHLGCPGL